MKKKVVAIMGSYRRGCAVDSIVDEVLRGAEES
ncbi:flavodoxin family protein, partial [bacterium]